MKYHKIRNVPMSICTAEQKIAYNLAFSYGSNFKKEFDRMPMQLQKSDVVFTAIHFCLKIWGNNEKANKYNIDAIQCALNAGMEDYLKNNCPILASYEEIGKAFPANYL